MNKSACILMASLCLFPVELRAFQIPERLTMQTAVDYALAHSPRIKSAEAHREAASALKLQSWALPKMEIGVEYEGMPGGTYFDTYDARKLKVNQGFEFPTTYLLRNRKHFSLLESARRSLDLERLSLAADVKTAYIDALLARSRVELAGENLTLSSSLMEKAKLRYDLGEEASIDFLRAKLQKERAENSVLAAGVGFKEAKERLLLLLTGESPPENAAGIVISGELAFEPVDIDALHLDEAILEEHVQMLIDKNRLDAASRSLSLAKSSFLPDFTVTLYKQSLDNIPGYWGMEFSLSVPVWFLSEQRGRIAEERANLKDAEWRRIGDSAQLHAEFRTALFALQEAEKQVVRFKEDILQVAEQVYQLADVQYREGETSYIDLLLAQQSLIETRGEYYDALADYNKSVVRFERAAGRPVR